MVKKRLNVRTVRVIHANQGVAGWYQARLNDAIREMHRDVLTGVLAGYSETKPAEMAHDARNPSIRLRRIMDRFALKWQKRLDRLSTKLSREFTDRNFRATQHQMRSAFADAGLTIKFAATPASQAAYQAVIAEQVNLIKSIPAQYLKAVQTDVWQSVMKGADLHELSTKLQKNYGTTRERAAFISRDQNLKAKAIIEQTRRQELGVEFAIWHHSSGGKVPRRTHIEMDGKPYRIAQGMYDSAEGRYILPGELPNCRCVSRAVIPAFESVESATAKALANRPAGLYQGAAARSR